ncbi:MAG: nucleotide exchange factor GrpE [Deltaproteobacteria bacterium]
MVEELKDTGEEKTEGTSEIEERFKKLEEDLKLKEAEAKENYEKFLRSCAELENFKKRSAREKDEFVKYSMERMVRELLPVLDNLERAVEHSKASQDFSGLVEGVDMTLKQFLQCLDKFGVIPVSAMGEGFDPTKHEAIMQVEEGDYDADTVVGEHQKGYILNDRLLRPSLVTVAMGKKKLEEKGEAG